MLCNFRRGNPVFDGDFSNLLKLLMVFRLRVYMRVIALYDPLVFNKV